MSPPRKHRIRLGDFENPQLSRSKSIDKVVLIVDKSGPLESEKLQYGKEEGPLRHLFGVQRPPIVSTKAEVATSRQGASRLLLISLYTSIEKTPRPILSPKLIRSTRKLIWSAPKLIRSAPKLISVHPKANGIKEAKGNLLVFNKTCHRHTIAKNVRSQRKRKAIWIVIWLAKRHVAIEYAWSIVRYVVKTLHTIRV